MIKPSKYEEKYIIDILKSGMLKEMKIFQVDESFFELNDGQTLLVDGGIQFQFPKGIFCVGWSSELDLFTFHKEKFDSIYEQANFIEIENKTLLNLVGDFVNQDKFKTLDFEVIADYTMRTEKVKRFVEVILEFESGKNLQLSLITYDTETGKAPFNYRYDLSTELLITLNEEIEIKT